MIKVIRKGSLREVKCFKCRSLLEYDRDEDVQEPKRYFGVYRGYIKCPICGEAVFLDKE